MAQNLLERYKEGIVKKADMHRYTSEGMEEDQIDDLIERYYEILQIYEASN
jgi:hypothetical protein